MQNPWCLTSVREAVGAAQYKVYVKLCLALGPPLPVLLQVPPGSLTVHSGARVVSSCVGTESTTCDTFSNRSYFHRGTGGCRSSCLKTSCSCQVWYHLSPHPSSFLSAEAAHLYYKASLGCRAKPCLKKKKYEKKTKVKTGRGREGAATLGL